MTTMPMVFPLRGIVISTIQMSMETLPYLAGKKSFPFAEMGNQTPVVLLRMKTMNAGRIKMPVSRIALLKERLALGLITRQGGMRAVGINLSKTLVLLPRVHIVAIKETSFV